MSDRPASGWYADPTGRFDHRYWDGESWTEHVSRDGQATTDPLDGVGTTRVEGDGDPAPSRDASWQTAPWEAQASASKPTNPKAIISLVLSIIWLGGLASIAALVLGIMAKREIRERPDEGGQGVATAGIIIAIIGIVGALLLLVAILSFIGLGIGETMIVGLDGR